MHTTCDVLGTEFRQKMRQLKTDVPSCANYYNRCGNHSDVLSTIPVLVFRTALCAGRRSLGGE